MRTTFGCAVIFFAACSCDGSAHDPAAKTAELVNPPSKVIEKLTIPVFKADRLRDNADDLNLAVSATDAAGRGPDQAGFAGSSRNGQCRVYFDGISPVTSEELYDRGFSHLDQVVRAAGGVDALLKAPKKIPVANIWGDANTPWRCIAGAVFNVQAAGYPTVGFVSDSGRTGAIGLEMDEVYHDLAIPTPVPDLAISNHPARQQSIKLLANIIVIAADGRILWNGMAVAPNQLTALLRRSLSLPVVPALHLEPDANASYGLSAQVINIIEKSGVTKFDFTGIEKYRAFSKRGGEVAPSRSGG